MSGPPKLPKLPTFDEFLSQPLGQNNTVFNDIATAYIPGGSAFDQWKQSEERRATKKAKEQNAAQIAALRKNLPGELLKAREAGQLSQDTYAELLAQAGDKKANLNSIVDTFTAETQGTTAAGRSRLATQKMFDLMIDRPGRSQTLLTPRSNASRSIVGV